MKKIEWSLDLLQKLPKSKNDALAQGSKYYFDGAFCKESHTSPRIVKSGRCFICNREETKKLAESRRRSAGVVSNRLEVIESGLKFGSLETTGNERFIKDKKRNRREVEVICACGKSYWIRREQLINTTCCLECAKKMLGTYSITHGQSHDLLYQLIASAKKRAKKSGLEFNLSLDNIETPHKCPVFGIDLDWSKRLSHDDRTHRDNAPSIDRINPNDGYVLGNVAIISARANWVKSDGSFEEHQRIADYLRNKGL